MSRERKRALRILLAQGIDPSQHRKQAYAQNRANDKNHFEVIAHEWLVTYGHRWSSSYAQKIQAGLERNVFPWIGTIPVHALTPPQLLGVVRRMEARGVLESAHRTLGHCNRILRYAVATGRAERNVGADLKGALPPVKGQHFPAVVEPKQVGALLRALAGYKGTFVVHCALQLAPLVFVRPGELRTAQWSDIDFDKAAWRYVVSKTQTPHIVPLATQAMAILKSLQPLTGRGCYVFPSARTPTRPMTVPPIYKNAVT